MAIFVGMHNYIPCLNDTIQCIMTKLTLKMVISSAADDELCGIFLYVAWSGIRHTMGMVCWQMNHMKSNI